MTLEQKGQKKMLAYDLHFALLMRHEYRRRGTRNPRWFFFTRHKFRALVSRFDEQSGLTPGKKQNTP